jgi:hypothetical protein
MRLHAHRRASSAFALSAMLAAGVAQAQLAITEVAPWSSGNSPVAADWIEITNFGASAVDITGYRIDDASNSFASSVALVGITSIAAGESVIFIEGASANANFVSTWFGAATRARASALEPAAMPSTCTRRPARWSRASTSAPRRAPLRLPASTTAPACRA